VKYFCEAHLQQDEYVRDISYTPGFYPQLSPHWLSFSALIASREAGRGLRPRHVYELGIGQGFGLALLAAANPDVSFEGCDFNPDHVARARCFIADSELPNIAVSETSFAGLAQAGGARDIDVALAHGLVSWVAPDVQRDIVAFLGARLRDDGLFYVSYNAPPAWAPLAPVRDLMLEVKRRAAGGSQAQLDLALGWLRRLRRANAPLFAANPAAALHVDGMLAMDPAYLAHEYFAEAATPLGFAEAVALLAPAGLAYAASAQLVDNFDSLGIPAAALPLLAQTEDSVLRETLRDFAVNRFFRRDVFMRDVCVLAPVQQRAALSAFRFILCVPRGRLGLDFVGPAGALSGRPDLYGPLADRLAGGAGLAELATLPPFDGRFDRLLECLVLLVDSHQALAVPTARSVDARPARRFNAMVIDAARQSQVYGHLASPVAGTGVPVSDFDLLALAAIADGTSLDPEKLAQAGLAALVARGRRPMHDGVEIEDEAEAVASLVEPMRRIVDEDLPVWRRLGVL
jgi:SAM-dependent methyltransferase